METVGRDHARDSNVPNFLRLTCGMRMSRASSLAGASLITLVAFAADRALAKCSGPDQTFSTATTGPVFSDGGAIAVTTRGRITGANGVTGLDGVEAAKCRVTTLSNSGKIAGGAGDASLTNGFGGVGVSNAGTIKKLTNSGAIAGGPSGHGPSANVVGGAGVSNSGTIGKLINSGTITGASATSYFSANAVGGTGVRNSGTITKLTNSGTIAGGGASSAGGAATPGDAIYSAGPNARMGTIVNKGLIVGNVEIDNQ